MPALPIAMPSTLLARQTGFSLVEILCALAVLAILAGAAISSASAALQASRSSNALASLLASLTRARSGAANAGVEVVMCPSQDGATCASGFHWESGWIAFVAAHGNSERQPDDPILLRQDALPQQVRLVSTRGRTRIRFQSNGGNVGSNVTFTFCDARGPEKASAYAMGNNGILHEASLSSANVAEACAGP